MHRSALAFRLTSTIVLMLAVFAVECDQVKKEGAGVVTQSPASPRGKVCVGDTKPSRQLKRWTVQTVTKKVAVDTASCYNPNELGIRLAVGRRTLDPLGQVRILDPQPGNY